MNHGKRHKSKRDIRANMARKEAKEEMLAQKKREERYYQARLREEKKVNIKIMQNFIWSLSSIVKNDFIIDTWNIRSYLYKYWKSGGFRL